MTKQCFIIAGPNGAGKTTFATDFLPKEANCLHYINADLIASGISPFAPELKAVEAGRLMLKEIDRCISEELTFAFETTLSAKSYLKKIEQWKALGYQILLFYFSLPSEEMAIKRVKHRVENGGHNIPEDTIRRRYKRSKDNLENLYKGAIDTWVVFDTSSSEPIIVEIS